MRSRSEPLSRDVIVEAALAHVELGDLESLSARGLAAELGVTPMALYRHVRNKEEILAGVVDVLLARLGLPRRSGDWRRWLESLARSLRRLFEEQPVTVAVFARQPVTTPAARHRLAASVEVLTAAGFGEEDAVRAYAAVHTYTVGFCTLEAARRAGGSPPPVAGDGEAEVIAHFVSDDQFNHGLQALLAGLSPRR